MTDTMECGEDPVHWYLLAWTFVPRYIAFLGEPSLKTEAGQHKCPFGHQEGHKPRSQILN